MPESLDTIRSHCNMCGGQRKHLILYREATSWDEDLGYGNSIWGTDTYFLLKCAGCDTVHLRHESTFSEDHNDDNPSVRYYPPAISRRQPAWMSSIGWNIADIEEISIHQLLQEIYTALQNDSRRLAVMGIRAALEVMMIDKVGDHGTIGKNIAAFLDAGFVPSVSHDLFRDTLIESGHAAMHRSYQPTKEHLEVLLDLTEWLIVSIYVHPSSAAKVQAKLPTRSRPTKEKSPPHEGTGGNH